MDVGSAHGLISGTKLALAWTKENKKKFIRIVSVLDEILTGHLLYENQNYYNFIQLAVSNKTYINSLVLELNPSSNLQHCEFKLQDLIFVTQTLNSSPTTTTCE